MSRVKCCSRSFASFLDELFNCLFVPAFIFYISMLAIVWLEWWLEASDFMFVCTYMFVWVWLFVVRHQVLSWRCHWYTQKIGLDAAFVHWKRTQAVCLWVNSRNCSWSDITKTWLCMFDKLVTMLFVYLLCMLFDEFSFEDSSRSFTDSLYMRRLIVMLSMQNS